MSVISRRQKEILLSDVQRMINNNNHTAFANHAKIAERITNGDLAFYIDSPKKEFVIKYGNKEIRFNCNDQQMTELKGIKFDDNSVIKGISDSTTSDSSNIALSTKWGKSHNHDNDYSKKNGIGLVKAADTILKGNDHKIFFQGLKYEGRGNKI